MKNAALIAILASLALNACRSLPPAAPPVTMECENAPRWYKTDAAGKPVIAIYQCYRSDNTLGYNARALTAQETAALMSAPPTPAATMPKAKPAPKAKPKAEPENADAAHDKNLRALKRKHEQEAADARAEKLQAEVQQTIHNMKVKDEKDRQRAAAERAIAASQRP